MKKIFFIAGVITTLTIGVAFAASNSFLDIKSGDRFASAAENLKEWGVITPYKDGTFRPKNKVTRGDLAIILDKFDEHIRNTLPSGNPAQKPDQRLAAIEERLKRLEYLQVNSQAIDEVQTRINEKIYKLEKDMDVAVDFDTALAASDLNLSNRINDVVNQTNKNTTAIADICILLLGKQC